MGRRRRSSKRSDRRTSAQSATKLAREHYPLALRAGVNKSPLALTIGWRGDYSSTLAECDSRLRPASLPVYASKPSFGLQRPLRTLEPVLRFGNTRAWAAG